MNVQLRDLKLDDAVYIQENCTNPMIKNRLKINQLSSILDDIHLFILRSKKPYKNKQINKAIIFENEIIGTISLILQDDVACKSGELVFWISENFWDRGIMKKSVQKMCELGFTEFNLERIFAIPIFENKRARKVLEMSGFELEGIMRKSIFLNNLIHNACMYALLK